MCVMVSLACLAESFIVVSMACLATPSKHDVCLASPNRLPRSIQSFG